MSITIMDRLSPCNNALAHALTTSRSISLVRGSLADFSFNLSTSDLMTLNSVPFPSMPSEKGLPTLEFSCSVLSMLEGLVKVKNSERRIGSLNAFAKQCLAPQASALQVSNSSFSFLEEFVKEKAVEPQVFSLMSFVAAIPLPVLEEDRASEEGTLTASPALDDEAFANFRIPFDVPTSTSEDTFTSGTLSASPALDDEAFANYRMDLDDSTPIVILEPPTPVLTASPTSTVLTSSPTSTIFSAPSATQSLLLVNSSLSIGDLPLGDISFISVASIPVPELEDKRAPEAKDTFASGNLTASPELDDEAFTNLRTDVDDPMPIVALESPTPVLNASPTSVLTASPTSTIFSAPSATQSLLLPGSSLSLGDLSLPLGDVSFISVASIAVPVLEGSGVSEEGTLTTSPVLDDEAFASFRAPLDVDGLTPIVTLEPPTPVLTTSPTTPMLTASPTSTIFAFPSATQSLLLPGSSLSLGDLSLPLGDVSFSGIDTVPVPVLEEKNGASEEGTLTASPALDDEAFANFRMDLDVTFAVEPPTPVLTLTASPTSTIFAFPSATQSLLLLPLPDPSFSGSLADLSVVDVSLSFISSLGLISPEAQKEIDEADSRLESLLASSKATGRECVPPIKAESERPVSEFIEDEDRDVRVEALAHDWDEEGEFALFEYNLVSRACSHPEFGFLCDIIEEHEGEYEQKEEEEEGEKGRRGLAQDWDEDGEFALFEYNLVSRECSHPELDMLYYIAEDEEDEEWVKEMAFFEDEEDEEWVKEMAFFEDEDEEEDEEWVKEMAFFQDDEDEDEEWVNLKEMEGTVSLYGPILEEVDWVMTPTMMQDQDEDSLFD